MTDVENEVWKTIIDYPKYEVSSFGRVRDKVTHKQKYYTYVSGCRFVNLRKDNRLIRVDRLVANAFLTEPNLKHNHLKHIDGVNDNDYINNLKWCKPNNKFK